MGSEAGPNKRLDVVRQARARPPRLSAALRSEAILQASTDVLIGEGYARFSLRRVAAASGVRLSTVQHHFPTHQALLVATVDRAIAAWDARYGTALQRVDLPPDKRLQSLLAVILELAAAPSETPFMLELMAFANHEPVVLERVRSCFLSYRKQLASVLGEIRPDLGRERRLAFATAMAAQWEGIAFYSLPGDQAVLDSARLWEVMDLNLTTFLEGFRTYVEPATA